MQPLRKYSRLKLAHLRQSRGCTKNQCKKCNYNYAPISKIFSLMSSRHMCKQPFRWKFRSEELHSRVLSFESGKIHFSRFFHVFDPPNGEKGSSWGADFGVVGKPIPTFLIAVHWSHFDISVRFLTNRLNIAKKTRFSSAGSLRR